MKLTYFPAKDELFLKISPIKRKRYKKFNSFQIWSDDEGNIGALVITNYTRELDEFNSNLNLIQLGGIWKGIKISEEDIKEARAELLKRLEDKW